MTLPSNPRPSCPAEYWFGNRFADLHPLLQRLHREGGRLSGWVEFEGRTGIPGMIGALVKRRLKLSADGKHRLSVHICDHGGSLHWSRRFDDGAEVVSLFKPIGQLPDGYWLERAGPMTLKLTVEIIDGGWYWRQLSCRIFGVSLPRWFAPRVDAHKQIVDNGYRFAVAIALPIVGRVIAYGGTLALETHSIAATV
jgi:hypothetical protein